MEKVKFDSHGEKVRGTLFLPKHLRNKAPGVIFFHGMTSSEDSSLQYAEHLAELGIAGLTVSIRGHGRSEGTFNNLKVTDAVLDGISAYDYLKSLPGIDGNRIGLAGSSVGAAIASLITEQRDVKSLVLRVPGAYTTVMMNMTYEQIMAKEDTIFGEIADIKSAPPVQAVAKFRGSVLVVASENDDVIPRAIPNEYFASAVSAEKRKLMVMKDARHSLSGNQQWKDQFSEMISKWFQGTL